MGTNAPLLGVIIALPAGLSGVRRDPTVNDSDTFQNDFAPYTRRVTAVFSHSMKSRWVILVSVFAAAAFAQPGEPAPNRQPLGIVTAITAGEAGGRPEIVRAGTSLGLGVRSGELLFAGDKISSGSASISFTFCPNRSHQTLDPAGAIEFAHDDFAVSQGRIAGRAAAQFCRLPDLTGLPAANLQHYGGALTRSLGADDNTSTFEQRVAKLTEERRAQLAAELKPIDAALIADADDVDARMARAAVLVEFGLNSDAAAELQALAGRHPGATGTRALVHELFEREAPVREPRGDPQTYALVVGVSRYLKLPEEQQLLFARADADIFYRYLASPAGGQVPKENIVLITDEAATKAAIENALETFLRARAQKGDTVVVFIAAHGTVDETGAYILAHDSDPQDLRTTALPMASIQQLMDTQLSQVSRVVVYVDVCRAGTIGQIRSNEINVVVGNILAAPSEIFAMMGSGPKEYSYESDNFGEGHGAFSYFLVRALCGAADADEDDGNQDGETTVDEVVEFVETQVRRATRRKQNPESIVRINRDEPLTTNPVCEFDIAGFKPLSETEVAVVRSIEVPAGPAERFLDQYERAISNGDILPETPGSAFAPLRQLKGRLGDHRKVARNT